MVNVNSTITESWIERVLVMV